MSTNGQEALARLSKPAPGWERHTVHRDGVAYTFRVPTRRDLREMQYRVGCSAYPVPAAGELAEAVRAWAEAADARDLSLALQAVSLPEPSLSAVIAWRRIEAEAGKADPVIREMLARRAVGLAEQADLALAMLLVAIDGVPADEAAIERIPEALAVSLGIEAMGLFRLGGDDAKN